ncbi:MAG: TetR/AcrR family transcriptional regulator [Candidatus Kapabacteria bacterium]|nr:TetR/AcrR family transcriptional regulator [Candidatus Kapabacteria bacterium]
MRRYPLARERVLDAAEHLFVRYGYVKVTTEEIARDAGLSKKTLYELFAAKSAIVTALSIRSGRSILFALRDVLDASPTAFSTAFSRFLAVAANANARFSGPLRSDLALAEPALYCRIDGLRRRFLRDALKRTLTRGQEMGSIRSTLDMDGTAIVLQSALDTMLHPDSTQSSPRPLPDSETILSILLLGISAQTTVHG